jgi:hypothetical protein
LHDWEATAVKIALSFISGVIVCGLILFGARSVLPIKAETDNLSEQSENLTQGLIDLLPDIEKIYREALTTPFREAQSKIYDEDIAQFYQKLMDNTGLAGTGDGTD